jgi:hypothetical protein
MEKNVGVEMKLLSKLQTQPIAMSLVTAILGRIAVVHGVSTCSKTLMERLPQLRKPLYPLDGQVSAA